MFTERAAGGVPAGRAAAGQAQADVLPVRRRHAVSEHRGAGAGLAL